MPGAGRHALADPLLDRARPGAILEEGHVLLPRQADHDHQPVCLRAVEQPARGHRVGTDGVDSGRGHRGEVGVDDVR